jgi:DNA-binding response OmpR family regulator
VNVLICVAERHIERLIEVNMVRQRYETRTAGDQERAFELLSGEDWPVDLLILDRQLSWATLGEQWAAQFGVRCFAFGPDGKPYRK